MNILKKYIYYIITFVFIISLYIILEPKIMPVIFGKRNNTLLNNFIQTTTKNKKIDVQEFWKMREFFCPGVLTYDKTKNPFITYNCKWFNSQEYFIRSPNILKLPKLDKKNAILQTNNILIYRNSQKLFIYFIVPEKEMRKAIGVIDYLSKDKNLINNRLWLDISIIDL